MEIRPAPWKRNSAEQNRIASAGVMSSKESYLCTIISAIVKLMIINTAARRIRNPSIIIIPANSCRYTEATAQVIGKGK